MSTAAPAETEAKNPWPLSTAWRVEVGVSPTGAGVQRFLDWWRAEVPRFGRLDRRRFDPAQHKAMLPWMFILSPTADRSDFRHRLIGTGLVELVGQDLTGRAVTDLYKEEAEARSVAAFYSEVLETGLPVIVRGRFDRRSIGSRPDPTAEFEGIHLPAWDSKLAEPVILGGLFPTGRSFRMGSLAAPASKSGPPGPSKAAPTR